MVFGVSRPKRLSVVDVKEFGKARQELERRDVGSFGDGVRRCAHPLPETGERPLYAVRDCVGRELRHIAKSLSEVRQMFREGCLTERRRAAEDAELVGAIVLNRPRFAAAAA